MYDVRGLGAVPGGADVLVRAGENDAGSYGSLAWLDPDEPPDPDVSASVEERLRESFERDPRVSVAVVDGRDVGLTIDGAVGGIRRVLRTWRGEGREIRPDQRLIVLTGDGTAVVWRGDAGTISVSE